MKKDKIVTPPPQKKAEKTQQKNPTKNTNQQIIILKPYAIFLRTILSSLWLILQHILAVYLCQALK